MFLALTVLLTLLEISFSRRHPRRRHNRPRPRQSKRFKGGRTGRNDPDFHDTHEYLEGYSYQSYSSEEPNGSDGDSYGESNSVECNEQEYDCENYSYEIVEPPRPATTKRPAPTPAPNSVECDEKEYDCENYSYEIIEPPPIIVEPPRPATTKRPSTTRRPAPTPAPCQPPWIRLATGCYRLQIKSPSSFTF